MTAPRAHLGVGGLVADFGETRLYTPEVASTYGPLEPLVAQRQIREH